MDLTPKQIAECAIALSLAIALIAGIVDWRHKKRDDLDRVAWLDWRTVQYLALVAAAVAALIASTI